MQACQTDRFSALLSGEPVILSGWVATRHRATVWTCLGAIILGAGLYGAAMGWWRSPLQGLYVAIKFPVIILLVAGGNAVLNAMIAPLLGVPLSLRQSFMAVLMSFAIASAILGSFSPLTAYLVWNAPPLAAEVSRTSGSYAAVMLTHVILIAFAGIVANVHLLKLLWNIAGSRAAACRVLIAWLAGNLFLGSQLCWILRPFIGAPGLPVQFLRQEAFRGSFYEAVLASFLRITGMN